MKGNRGKTQRFPRFLCEYRGEVPGCPGGVGAYATVVTVRRIRWVVCPCV